MASFTTTAVEVVKSESDLREYRYIKLENKLSVLLISDPTTDQAAAAMSVGVGYFCDPENLPGIAHFCEHMLFLGTEKYPDENEYSSFLSSNGGYSNAYTSSEDTNYYFEINHPHLKGALKRFAQFFISPLFTEDGTARELEAVNSEHEKNLQSDLWRSHQMMQSTCSKKHPFSKFGTGSKATLDTPETRNALLDFHTQYYSSNIMNLVVLGAEGLDGLEGYVRDNFSQIENKDVQVPRFTDVLPWEAEEKGQQFYTVPIKELRRVEIAFQFPSLKSEYRKHAPGYISHLLGDEGPGSILAALKAKGWAMDLMAGFGTHTWSFASMGVTIDLTEEGLEHIFEIVEIVFQYVHVMRTSKPQRWIWDEMKTINANNFRFLPKSNPSGYVSGLAASMGTFEPSDVLCARYLAREYDEGLISSLIELLVPENCRIRFTSKRYVDLTDEKEPWYGTPYKREKIPSDFLAKLKAPVSIDPLLKLPEKNMFIAEDFSLRREDVARKANPSLDSVEHLWLKQQDSVTADPSKRGAPPQAVKLVRLDAMAEVWFKQDDSFKQPKVNFVISLDTPLAYDTVTGCVMTDIFAKLVKDALNEFSYSADVAGLRYDICNTVGGLQVTFVGYNDKISLLAGRVAGTIANLEVKEDRFNVVKEKRRLSYRNFEKEQPYQWVLYNVTQGTRVPRWHNSDKAKMIEGVTVEDVRSFIPMLLRRTKIQAIVHGNATKEEALALVESFEKPLGSSPLAEAETILLQRIVSLPRGSSYVYSEPVHDPENINSSIEVYFQIGASTHAASARGGLLAAIMNEPCFDQLRTKLQLGYIVFSGTVSDEGILGIRVIIQSGKCGPAALDEHIESFLETFRKEHLEKMAEEDFIKHRDSFIMEKIKKSRTMREETYLYFGEMQNRTYCFDRSWKEANELDSVTLKDVIAFFDSHIAAGAPERRKLSVQIVGKNHEGEKAGDTGGTVVEDLYSFKRSLPLFPLNCKHPGAAEQER
jgi:insulysin